LISLQNDTERANKEGLISIAVGESSSFWQENVAEPSQSNIILHMKVWFKSLSIQDTAHTFSVQVRIYRLAIIKMILESILFIAYCKFLPASALSLGALKLTQNRMGRPARSKGESSDDSEKSKEESSSDSIMNQVQTMPCADGISSVASSPWYIRNQEMRMHGVKWNECPLGGYMPPYMAETNRLARARRI